MSSRPSRGAARLAAILDALPDALLLVNANGTVVNANTIALETFEAPGTALVGRGLLDLLPQFDSKLIPGSMRRPDHMDPRGRTKPTRMVARRTDGTEFPVEVTSANLENGQQAYDGSGYTGDELLMLVVRDLSGTVDTEAELARSQRQTEMILRAASEGVVGTDTDGRIVLVNPAAAQILGYRAGELGGKELHNLVLHSRADGSPFPYAESPLADTLRSGRKHRVRGQVLWAKNGDEVSVDLTTAPVRDGDQLVGAVMTFTDRRGYQALADEKSGLEKAHAEELEKLSEEHASDLTALRQKHVAELEELREDRDTKLAALRKERDTELAELRETQQEALAAGEERYAALAEREKDRHEALAARHEQLLTLLSGSLRGPLDELRRELAALAADDAGQLWPEANQVLHHLSAGYARITALIDNVLSYQRLDSGSEDITRTKVMLDAVVAAGVDGAVELIGPGRVQFAVHAPPIEAEVDPQRLATALAHLVADVAGVDATGNAPVSAGGYLDNTVVVAAAQRGEVARIEVRGPYAGGDAVHEPIVRGIVRAHGGVLQTHEVPGMSGSAYVLEVPLGGGAGTVALRLPAVQEDAADEAPEAQDADRRVRRSSTDAFLDSDLSAAGPVSGDANAPAPTGRRRRRGAPAQEGGGPAALETAQAASGGTGRRRGRSADASAASAAGAGQDAVAEGAVMTAAEHAAGTAAVASGLGAAVPPQGVPASGGREEQAALPPALPAAPDPRVAEAVQPTGRRRRALGTAPEAAGAAQEAAAQGPRPVFALPPAEADRTPEAPAPIPAPAPGGEGQHDAVPVDQDDDHTPPQPHPTTAPTGRRRRAVAQPSEPTREAQGVARVAPQAQPGAAVPGAPGVPAQVPGQPLPVPGIPGQAAPAAGQPVAGAGQPAAVAGQAVPVPGQAVPAAGQPGAPVGQAVAVAGQVAPVPGQAVPVPAQAAPAPGQPLPVPGQPVPVPGQAVPVPGQPVAMVPGQAVAVPGQAPGAAVPAPVPGPAVALPAQAAGAPVAAPGQPLPVPGQVAPVAAQVAGQPAPIPAQGTPVPAQAPAPADAAQAPAQTAPQAGPQPLPAEAAAPAFPQAWPDDDEDDTAGAGVPAPQASALPPRAAQPLPAEAPGAPAYDPTSTQAHAISVRTLGQGVPFVRQAAQVQQAGQAQQTPQTPQPGATPPPHGTNGGGRRRKLGTPPAARPEAQPEQPGRPHATGETAQPSLAGQARLAPGTEGIGRSYAIGAPDANAAEGPEPLDGPGGAVEVADTPRPQPLDDELPPEPLDNPRRLLVWPAPDTTTQQALSDRGYRPVVVHSREEVDAQIAAFPAALFVDPLTGPITRTALQSLRQAAVAAEVPVLVTAGLGQASREAAYGADPAVLLKALAPRDSEQHPPRVLLVEEHAEIALALTATLERRGMQVARAASDGDAVTLAGQFRPNLVVMDLLQMQRQQAGIVDWLRTNGQLTRTPLVVYTATVAPADLPRLASGESVLFLAERATTDEVQARIVDLLARIGTN
ncbi:PAS domain-containing protein [Streptomyces sp. LaPpAH-108]|uniref:PAS domain-containing protein n=1 Tax=Streptomyces sp. LaPpAH-108 TaxID=1155714 RepID=UPI0003A33CBB|nr:PAS domain-containing protein [Streptomyces sp. LaPpAH-108]